MTGVYIWRALELVANNALAAVVVAVLALTPGYGLARGAARRLGWGLETTLPAAFGVTLGFVTIFVVVADRTFGLLAAGLFALGLSVAGWWWGSHDVGEPVPAVAERRAWLTGIAAAVLAAVEGPYMAFTADTFYHMAAVRSLLERGTALVTDPIYGTATTAGDPAAGTWHTMVALWSWLTSADPVWLWGGLNVVVAGLLAMAFWALARRVSGSARAATIATAAWIVFAQFADMRMAAFPKVGTFALVFVVLAILIDLADRPKLIAGAVAAVSLAGVLGAHLGSAQLALTAAGAIAVWLSVRAIIVRWRDKAAAGPGLGAVVLTTAAGVALALPELWARVAPLNAAGGLGAGLGASARETLAPRLLQLPFGLWISRPGTLTGGGAALTIVASLIVIAMLVSALRPGGTAGAVAGAGIAALPLLTIYDPVFATVLYRVSPYVLDRVGAIMGFAAYLAIAWGLGVLTAEGRARTLARGAAYVGLAAAVVGVGAYPALTFVRIPGSERRGARYPIYITRLQDMRYVWGDGLTQAVALTAASPKPPVVAGDLETGYYFVGLARASLLALMKSHSPYVVENDSGPARRADNEALLIPGAGEASRRAIVERWSVDYVVFWLERDTQNASFEDMKAQSGLFSVAVDTPAFAMLAVKR